MDEVYKQIVNIAKKYNTKKVVLFGSRARGTNHPKSDIDLVDIDDLSATTHDPLLAQLRYRLRKHHRAARAGKKIGVSCVFSRESVAPPDASCAVESGGDGSLNCHGYGSVVAVTATFGQCAAGWVLDKIAGVSS